MNKLYLKSKYIIIAIICSSMVITSCEDFLDKKPYDFISSETFYKDENDCIMALAGIYWTLASEEVYANMYSALLTNSDDISYSTKANSSDDVSVNSMLTSNAMISRVWTSLYSGINNANLLLENIEKANISDNKIKNRIKGEAKFLRAYYHFLLVQGWYEVPVRKESIKNVKDCSLASTSHEDALDWIIQEMEDCIDLVDDSEYDKSPSHVKKTVVEGILARVCLWRAGYPSNGGKPFYEKAAFYANEVVKSNKHKLFPNNEGDGVYTLWKNLASNKYETTYNESMWEVEFIGSVIDGNFTWSRLGNTLGNKQDNPSQTGKGYGYGFSCGSLILWDIFQKHPEDNRIDLSLAPYYLDKQDKQVQWKDTEIVQRRCGKFRREWSPTSPKHKNQDQINFPILRYSDVLLMLAEAENEKEQRPTDVAYMALNEVKKRANIPEVSSLSYEEFQKELRDERARELCFESLRRFDLVRWGIYYESIKENLGKATEDKRWATSYPYMAGKQFVNNTEEKHQFFPIPLKELGVNKLLKQNKYWSNIENN